MKRFRAFDAIHIKKLFIGIPCGLLLITSFHIVATQSESGLWIAIVLRFFYVPAIIGGVVGGFLPGMISGALAAGLHLALMLTAPHSGTHEHSILLEHLVETPFLFLAGALTGFLSDLEQRERLRRMEVSDLFGRYISASVAEQILNKEIDLEGEDKEAAVLFGDLVGFTTLAEGMQPRDLLVLLNRHFSEMTEIVFANSGFLDKFIGDAIMAVYGIPFSDDDDADRAVASAIAMQRRILELNNSGAFGTYRLSMTIGIHYGRLIAGNVGSLRRSDYTVLGDTVNLASRIQSLNRLYGSTILLSDAVRARLLPGQGSGHLRELDSVRVRGRQEPSVLYEILLPEHSDADKRRLKVAPDFQKGLSLYKSGHFADAEEIFRALYETMPEDRAVSLYLKRAAEYRENPPPAWNGITEFTAKY